MNNQHDKETILEGFHRWQNTIPVDWNFLGRATRGTYPKLMWILFKLDLI